MTAEADGAGEIMEPETHVAQVTNVAPPVTLDQVQTLFGYLGKIDEIKMYPM